MRLTRIQTPVSRTYLDLHSPLVNLSVYLSGGPGQVLAGLGVGSVGRAVLVSYGCSGGEFNAPMLTKQLLYR